MWRYFVGAGAAILLAVAGMFLFRGGAAPEAKLPPAPAAAAVAGQDEPLPDQAPSAAAKTREQKRFDRVDKDKNESITRDEFFALRRRAFARLDANHDGNLSFDEWAVKGIARFTGADKDKSGALTRAEFATTAVQRKPRPACRCAPARDAKAAPPPQEAEGESDD